MSCACIIWISEPTETKLAKMGSSSVCLTQAQPSRTLEEYLPSDTNIGGRNERLWSNIPSLTGQASTYLHQGRHHMQPGR